MAKRTRNKPITTPRGIAVWPHLHAPDTKFDANGIYSTKLQLGQEDGQQLLDTLAPHLERSVAEAQEELREKGKKVKVKTADISVTENEDDTFTFNFKMKASGKRKDGSVWERKPRLFDAQGKPLPEGVRVGSGSIIKVAFEPGYYYVPANKAAGVSLRLEAVQVLQLVEFGGSRNAAEFGFDEEEDGFSADDLDPASLFNGDDEGSAGADDTEDEDEEEDGDF